MSAPLPAVDPFLEIEARQDEVLARLDELNARLEKLLEESQRALKLAPAPLADAA
jgi:hypothetical protein